jgi:hypothetical protein
MSFHKVKENVSYVKNPETGNVINTRTGDYKARKRKLMAEQRKNSEINDLKSELSEMKEMMKMLLQEKLDGN